MPVIEESDKRIAELIRATRKQLGLTQDEVAARTNDLVAQRTVSDIERGHFPLLSLQGDRMLSLLAALNIPLSEIIEGEWLKVATMTREQPSELPVLSMSQRGNPALPPLMQPLTGHDVGMSPFVHCYVIEDNSNAPTINASDRILVDTSKAAKSPVDGKFFMFEADREYRLARAREVDGKYLLIPDNAAFKTYSWASVSIVGLAIKRLRTDDL